MKTNPCVTRCGWGLYWQRKDSIHESIGGKCLFLLFFIFCFFRAESVTYTTAHGNTKPFTHWARPGIEPTTSWNLVRFISAAATKGIPMPLFIVIKCESKYRCFSIQLKLGWRLFNKMSKWKQARILIGNSYVPLFSIGQFYWDQWDGESRNTVKNWIESDSWNV